MVVSVNFSYNRLLAALSVCAVVAYCVPVLAKGAEASKDDRITYARPFEAPQPENNRITGYRVELGKSLFFDPRLSGSNFISCATCHNPALGWSDGQRTAVGHGMKVLGRSTPTIINTAFQKFQFWDGRAQSLEEQALGPIQADVEMSQSIEDLLAELSSIPGYIDMFEKAYPGEGVNKDTIAKAIATFERTILSTEAPFDRWLSGKNRAISNSAKNGFTIFKGKANCVACHSGFNFSDDGFHNIGLKDNTDMGRYALKPIAVLKGAFKTPTLRDVALTGPYMHNGQYATLEEVIDHYDRGGDTSENLDPNMKPLHLADKEKADLVAFLKALSGEPVQMTIPALPVR